ncbi:MAG: hypothetical protein JEY99_15225 [Spirochaetales bacterium]|nr:hypothetical protein [Spirochaetales bacterium]
MTEKVKEGIILSEKEIWEMTLKEHFIILLKRTIALPSKIIGFKPLCLTTATILLKNKLIDQWVWLIVLILVLFGITGLKITGRILASAADIRKPQI